MSRSYDEHANVDVSDGETALVTIETQAGTVWVEVTTNERSGEAVMHTNTDRYRDSGPFRWPAADAPEA